MATRRKSFSERVRGTSLFRSRSKATGDTIPEAGISGSLPPPSDFIASDTLQLGLLGEDLELKGKQVGSNLAALFTQRLYQDQKLRAPAKSNKPTAVTAEDMILEAFGTGDQLMTSGVSFQPTMVAFVKGIMQALQDKGVKADMEDYTKRRAAQSIEEATVSLQQKGEQMGNMTLDSIAKKVHKSKPVPDESVALAGPSFAPPAAMAEGTTASKHAPSEEPVQVQPRMLPFTSREEEEEEVCIDPGSCGIKKRTAAADEADEDPDLVALVLSPVVTGFNRAFSASAGVAKRVFSVLSMENIQDGLKCFMYEKYTSFLQQDATVSKLKGFGASAADKMLKHLMELDEASETSSDSAMLISAARNDTCEDRKLLPPLLEPVLAGMMEVLKSTEFRAKRRDAVWSLTRWWCWERDAA